MASAPKPPIPNCYWVLPGKLLAGEHPTGADAPQARARMKRLLGAGIDYFVDLTEPGELERYDLDLPSSVTYVNQPIADHGIPAQPAHMAVTLALLADALSSGRRPYVHCRAGIGRTGTVIGCLLRERGLASEEALAELNRRWRQSARSNQWVYVPETPEQTDYIRRWHDLRPASLPKAHAAGDESDPLLEPATLAVARSLRDRFLGGLLGLGVGDALAAATQYRRPGSFAPVGDLLGGGPFDLPRGAWSDDTAMTLCLAESLLERDGFDARDQVERYSRWQQEGHLSATGQCLGITASTARALALTQWRRQVFAGSHDPLQLDAEPLARVCSVVEFFFASPAEAIQQSREASRTTCQAPLVLDACRLFAAIVHGALSGRPKTQLLDPPAELVDRATLRPELAALLRSLRDPPATSTGPVEAVEVLRAALWAFAGSDNFRDGALRAVNLGGSSDVVGAVYGQLAGAHYGATAIPRPWRASLAAADLIETFADRLLAHAMVALSA